MIDHSKYDKYILKLLKDKRCEYRIFEKEKDMNLYNYFLPHFRNYIFPTFHWRGEMLKEFKSLKEEAQSKMISEQTVACFTYHLSDTVKGKADNSDMRYFL